MCVDQICFSGSKGSLWLRNIQLGAFGILFGLGGMAYNDGAKVSEKGRRLCEMDGNNLDKVDFVDFFDPLLHMSYDYYKNYNRVNCLYRHALVTKILDSGL